MKRTGNMKRYPLGIGVFTIAFLLFSFSSAFSQFNPIKFVRDSLPNGLQVIYHIDKSAPVVATVVHYRVGSRDENPSRTGFAHFFEHLMFEATTDISRATIDKYVQDAGGELNAHTGFDETVFYFKLPSNEIKLALWIESQRMRGLKVDTIGVETQRGVVKEERKMRNDNTPYGTFLEKMASHLFPGSSYSWTPIGSEQHIDNATISEFRTFYNNFYEPGNATLVVAGDIDINEAKKYVKEYFGGFPKAQEPAREPFKLLPLTEPYNETVEDTKAQLPGVFIGYRGPTLSDPDYYSLSLLTNILASGESSRLYQRLVDKDQLAVQASMFPLSMQYAGGIVLYGIASPGKKLQDIEEAITDEIQKIVKNGVSDDELQKAKNITEAEFVSGKKNVLEKAESLAQYYSYYGDPNLINTEIDKYMKVTKDDIIKVAKKYLGTDKRVLFNYVPKGYKG